MSNWENILFGNKEETERVLEFIKTLPGPSPWALRAESQTLSNYKWTESENEAIKAGKILLLNSKEQVLLVLNFYNYVMNLGNSRILIWSQNREENLISSPIVFTLLNLNELIPLKVDLMDIYKSDRLKLQGIYYDGYPEVQFELSPLLVNEYVKFEFPNQLKGIEELFVLCHSTGIRANVYGASNLGIMVLNPKENKFRIYPQEWFNTGRFDFGYQWITKIGREPVTKEIVGEGIRIGSFVLKLDYSGIKNVL